MIEVTIYCNIYNIENELVDDWFNLDSAEFDTMELAEAWIKQNGYVVDEEYGGWSNGSYAVVKEIIIEKIEEEH